MVCDIYFCHQQVKYAESYEIHIQRTLSWIKLVHHKMSVVTKETTVVFSNYYDNNNYFLIINAKASEITYLLFHRQFRLPIYIHRCSTLVAPFREIHQSLGASNVDRGSMFMTSSCIWWALWPFVMSVFCMVMRYKKMNIDLNVVFRELNFSIQWEIRVTPSQLFPRGTVPKQHGSNICSTETSSDALIF